MTTILIIWFVLTIAYTFFVPFKFKSNKALSWVSVILFFITGLLEIKQVFTYMFYNNFISKNENGQFVNYLNPEPRVDFFNPYFLFSFLFILTVVIGYWFSKQRDDDDIKTLTHLGFGVCPNCREKISRRASKCPYCTSAL